MRAHARITDGNARLVVNDAAVLVLLPRLGVVGILLNVVHSIDSKRRLAVTWDGVPVPRKYAQAAALLHALQVLLGFSHVGVDSVQVALHPL